MLTDGSEIPARSVIVATGARYRRLPVPDLDRYEGAGVYYEATAIEARGCTDREVVVVGGGNSAGQAAVFLAEQKSRVTIVVRRDGLEATMSRYLINRIEAEPNIDVLGQTEVRELVGGGHLAEVVLEHTPTGRRRTVLVRGAVLLHRRRSGDRVAARGRGARRQGLRAHRPRAARGHRLGAGVRSPGAVAVRDVGAGVFAVGDVRRGSLKRVAAAVGEGSSAVRSAYEHLATRRRPSGSGARRSPRVGFGG